MAIKSVNNTGHCLDGLEGAAGQQGRGAALLRGGKTPTAILHCCGVPEAFCDAVPAMAIEG